MNILYLLSQRPDKTGSGIYTRALIKQAAQAGHSCFLVAACSGNDVPDTSEIPAERIELILFEHGPLNFPIPGMSDVMPYPSSRFMDLDETQLEAYDQAFTQTIQAMVNDIRPDMIHSNHLWLMSALARQLAEDIPMMASCHGTDLRQFKNCPHLRNRVSPGIRKIPMISALSLSQKRDIMELFGINGQNIRVIPNGFDPTVFYPAPKAPPLPVTLLYAGKLASAKGVPLLLETLSHPALRDLPFHLELAGSGREDEEARCRDLARSIPDKVTFCGSLSPADLADRMRHAHLFVLPSFFEGLPLVLIEALASGCRIVATALPGAQELLQNIHEDWGCLIDLPPLETTDRPFDRDLPLIRNRLALALADQIQNRIMAQSPRPDCFEALTLSHSWHHVFKQLENGYQALVRP